jgi:putative two-component system response regulator
LSDSARILIVDDEPANVRLLERILERAGYSRLASTTDSRKVLGLVEAFDPDLILLDLRMPHRDGFAVLEELRPHLAGGFLPVLVLTADSTPQAWQRALSSGAKDFLTKPLDATEVVMRIRNLLETRFLYLTLEERVRERTLELEEARIEVLERLAYVVEFRDDDTGEHTRRVGEVSALLAGAMGLPERELELMRRAAPLHDIGKLAIPDAILLKPGRLTSEEFEVMKTHAAVGAGILARGRSEMMLRAEEIALAHHERWDGSGYPRALRGEEIPWTARIVALADFFDALSHDRPYRPAWKPELVIEEIERQSGRHFDPDVVEAFRTVQSQLERWVREEVPSSPPPSGPRIVR